mmetsp:Transcript_31247/g.87233  ORF Transcript_31247/g.87233 Transcript_31247/m.87233 type:complete len:185 (+) Transcript_31247:93-647(+)
MAFFGLTALGSQSPFTTAILDALDITIFSDEELRASFDKLDKDGSSNITIDELGPLLEDVYHGPAPKGEVERLMAIFDTNADGKISWDEFRITVKKMRNDKKRAEEDGKTTAAQEFKSSEAFRESMRRHKRPEKDPHDRFSTPLTTAQMVGWGGETGVTEVRYPKSSCEETKYAAAMSQSGVFY